MKNKILILDFYNVFIRNFHANPKMNANGEHFGAVVGFLGQLKYAIDRLNPSEVYVISDGPHSSLRRKMKNPDYKANRTKDWKRGSIRAYDFLNEKEQIENYGKQIKRLKEYLRVLPIKYMSIPYVEADDVIAHISNTVEDTEVVIYSSDKDYLQLIDGETVCYNPATKKIVTKEIFNQQHGFDPDKYIYLKITNGDKSDNVSGIGGVGEKTFLKMYPNIDDAELNNVDDFLELTRHSIESGANNFTKGILKKLNLVMESEERLHENWNLCQLKNADISLQSKDQIRELIYEKSPNKFDKRKLKFMFIQDMIEEHIIYFNDWSRVFTGLVLRGKEK